MASTRGAFKYVALMAVLLLYQSWALPPSTVGILTRVFQVGNLLAMLAIFGYAGVKLAARPAGPPGPPPVPPLPDEQKLKEAEALSPDSGVTDAWYHASETAVNDVSAALRVSAVLGLLGLVVYAFPASALGSIDAAVKDAWRYLLANYTHRQIYVNGIMIIFVVFWGLLGALFMVLDLVGTRWRGLRQFKIQPEFVPTLGHYAQSYAVGLMNAVIVYTVASLLFLWLPYINPDTFSEELPGLASFFFQLACFLPHSQAAFYIPHYMMHKNEWLMNHVHYVHHSRTATVAIECIYAHPLEFLCGNLPVLALGPIMVGSHCSVWLVWCAAAMTGTMFEHCGWQLPLLPGNQSHDYHHSHCAPGPEGYQSLGSGSLDALMHTDDFWREHSWQVRVDKTYKGPQYPVDRILVQHGELAFRGNAVGCEERQGEV